MDMFKFIANRIDLRKMSDESAKALVEHINCVLDNEKERKEVNYSPFFLCTLREQNRAITEDMDKKVAKYLPNYYGGDYKLETSENENQDMPGFVREYIERIRTSNEDQGKNGVYFGHGTRDIATVRTILLRKERVYDADTMDTLISAVADTLLISKEEISTKLDAIALLICIVVKYPEHYARNQCVFEKLYEQQSTIETADNSIISSNIDRASLKIGLQLLFASIGKNVYGDILESMPYIQGDVATTIAVTRLIAEYLESSDEVMLPSRVEAIILQNVLQWLHSEYTDIRWNATRILLTMSRNPENYGIVNHQLVNLIDSDSVSIRCRSFVLDLLHGYFSCRLMEAFQIGIKNLPVDKYSAIEAVNGPGIAGKLQQLLMGQAVHDFCLLVAQELAAQFAKLVGNFFHGFDGLVVVFHNLILRFL